MARRWPAGLRGEAGALAFLLLVVLVAHLSISNLPNNAYIFDEAYYVPAARALLAGQIVNLEHPPLAKALIAGSIAVFGDHAWAWRVPGILFGTLAVWIVFLLTRRLADARTALLAAFLLAFESLWFTLSSVAMLDVPAVSLALLGVLLFTKGEIVWAGAVLGLSMLAKEVTFVVPALLTLCTLLQAPAPLSRPSLRHAAEAGFLVTVSALVVFLVGLQVYDSFSEAFPTAFHHVAHMLRHNQAIAAPPAADAVRPFQWFSGFTPAGYLVSYVDLASGARRYFVQYFGQPNLVVVLLIWLALPAALPLARRRDPNALLHVLLFLGPFAFFVAMAHWRITYPYYMVLCLPSLCVLVATFLANLPQRVVAVYGFGVVLWFLVWFPNNLLALGLR